MCHVHRYTSAQYYLNGPPGRRRLYPIYILTLVCTSMALARTITHLQFVARIKMKTHVLLTGCGTSGRLQIESTTADIMRYRGTAPTGDTRWFRCSLNVQAAGKTMGKIMAYAPPRVRAKSATDRALTAAPGPPRSGAFYVARSRE